MAKIVTVWGSQGSGKTMFCCILAKALTGATKVAPGKKTALIINADTGVPMLPVWMPEQVVGSDASIGQVLSSVEIDSALVARHAQNSHCHHRIERKGGCPLHYVIILFPKHP